MTDISRLCMVCLSEADENGNCPDCRNNAEIVQASPLLPLKTVLAQRYLIAKMQKQNTEGITYSAYDIKLNKKVSIREFFPENLALRDSDEINVVAKKTAGNVYTQYLDKFIALWTKLMRLKGLSALITVTDVFKANSTAYAVYDESERITLRDYLLDTKEGFIPWEKTRLLFMPVLSTLGTLHTSGVLHRGLNPSAFIFSSGGKLKITDFCIEPARSASGALDGEFFDGYTPIEQYTGNEQTGAWTDIYSFCCVLYRTLIGTTPIDAKTRVINDQMMIPAKFAEQLPPYVINGLINGMEIKPEDRTDNIEQLRCDLSASPRAMGASANAYEELRERLSPARTGTPKKADEPPAQKPSNSPPHPENSPRTAVQTELPSSATKKINPFIMPLSPDNDPVSEDKTQAVKETAKPIPQKRESAAKAQKKTSPEYIEAAQKKRKILLISFCVLLGCIVISIVLLASSLLGKPLVGGVKVPDFVGMDLKEINADSNYLANFDIETVQQHSVEFPPNHIISQSIDANERVSKNSKITLTVSLGPKIMTMPDVSGKTLQEVKTILTDMGFVCETQNYISADSSKYGEIYEVVPAAGSYINQGDKVLIVIYAPPGEEEKTTSSSSNSGDSVSEFLQQFE